MTGTDIVDIVLGLILLSRMVAGLRTGAIRGFLGILGLICGAALGLWAGPQLLADFPQLSNRILSGIAMVIFVVVTAILGEILFGLLGRSLARGRGGVGGADSLIGGVVALLVTSLIMWFVATAARPFLPASAGQSVTDSRVLTVIDRVVPDRFNAYPSKATDALRNGIPRVFDGLVPEPQIPAAEPDEAVIKSPGVVDAADSVVQVLTDSPNCRSDSTGSGWVVARDRVVTNAHVVAGASTVWVEIGGEGQPLAANVVGFDGELDLAILAVPGLGLDPLARAGTQAPQNEVAAAGYPFGGKYTVTAGRVRGTITAQGQDIYGDGSASRKVYSIRGTVQPGNSGGPLLTPDGQVAGTVFAKSLIGDTAYVLTDEATAGWLDKAASLSVPVGAGACPA